MAIKNKSNTSQKPRAKTFKDGVKRIPIGQPPLASMPANIKKTWDSKDKGVFMLAQPAIRPVTGRVGPMGWDIENFPVDGANTEGVTSYYILRDAIAGYIVCAEAHQETEKSWLSPKVYPVADRTLPGFLAKLYSAATGHKDPKVNKMAKRVVKDLELEPYFIAKLKKEFNKTGRISMVNEDILASTINNPKRFPAV